MAESRFRSIRDIKNLVQNYLANGQLSKLDILSQLSFPLITEQYIIGNIDERCQARMYDGDGRSLVSSVKSDLTKIVPLDELSKLEACVDFFIRGDCLGALKRHVEHAIELCSPAEKQVVGALLRLYELSGRALEGALEPEGFLHSCSVAYDIETEIAEKWLVSLGLANRYYYSSTYIKHSAWNITEWAHSALSEIAQNPSQFGISVFTPSALSEAVAQTQAREFIEWSASQVGNISHGIIEFPEWEEGKRKLDGRHGTGTFDGQLGQLVEVGAIAIISTTGRNVRGYSVYINPNVLAMLS